MRAFAAVLLSIGMTVSPVFASNDATKDAANDVTVATSTETSPATTAPAKPAATTDSSAIENQLLDLRNLVEQAQELEQQRAMLKAEQLKMEALEEKLHPAAPSETETTPATGVTATEAIGVGPASSAVNPGSPAQKSAEEEVSPLYFKIGGAQFYPLGFMDLMNTTRTTQLGTLGTNFGSIALNNTVAGRLSEDRFSAQNSRIGLRTQAKFGQADVTGYLEADFLGYQPANANDTSNSNTLRMRLYWVDYRRGKLEIFGGQSWSFLTPNRNGLSALPGDLFYSQDVDTNYQLGLTWARQASFRVILHPTDKWAIGLALENPEQTLPSSVCIPNGSAGSSSTPGCSTSNTTYASQFDSNSGNTGSATGVNNPNTPNLHPDIILKSSFDNTVLGDHHVHFDVAGIFRTFKAVDVFATPSSITAANTVTSTSHGAGVAGTMNLELFKNFRWISTAFYGDGVGRYIGSTGAPDLYVRADGTLDSIHAGSGISGFEWQPNPKTVLYGYYSGVYIGKGFTGTSSANYVGYGYPTSNNSSNSDNRYLSEPTIGIHYMFWRNPNYGDLRIMTQYSYVSRTPWAYGSNPSTAHLSMVYVDLRYDLP